MKKLYLFLFLTTLQLQSQIILTHNIGSELIKTDMPSTNVSEYWSRTFTLEEFVIKHGQIGVRQAYGTTSISFDIYKIDNDFPDSFSELDLIGSSSESGAVHARDPEILEIEFEIPVVINHTIEKILVLAKKRIIDSPGSVAVFVAGTVDDNDFSWYARGGSIPPKLIKTIDLWNPKPNAKFYINVEGEKSSVLGVSDENTINKDKLIVLNNQNFSTLIISTQNKKIIQELTVYDILGRILISTKPNKSNFSVQTAEIGKGTILFLKAKLNDGQVLNVKTIAL